MASASGAEGRRFESCRGHRSETISRINLNPQVHLSGVTRPNLAYTSSTQDYHALMGDDTVVGPTALGEVVGTEALRAWALDPDPEPVPVSWWSPARITAAVLAASLVLIGSAGVVALVGIEDEVVAEPVVVPAAPVVVATPPPAEPLPPPPPPSTVTVTAAPPARQLEPPRPNPDAQFLALVRRIPNFVVYDEAAMTASGRSICTDLRYRGFSAEQIALANVGPNMPYVATSGVVNAAIVAYCPEYGGI